MKFKFDFGKGLHGESFPDTMFRKNLFLIFADFSFKMKKRHNLVDIYLMLRKWIFDLFVQYLNSWTSLQNNMTLREPEHGQERGKIRNWNNLVTPFPFVDNIKYQWMSIWNALPNYVNLKASLSKFKKSLSKYFFQMY